MVISTRSQKQPTKRFRCYSGGALTGMLVCGIFNFVANSYYIRH
jgi:hypothetical protein